MKIVLVTARHTWWWTFRLCVFFIILTALLLGVGRIALPYLGDYRASLEQEIGRYLHASVRISALQLAWEGWGPTIRMTGFSLHSAPSPVSAANFEQARASVDLPRSLLAGRLIFANVRLEGARLVLSPGSPLISVAERLDELASWLLHVQSLDLLLDELELQISSVSSLTVENLRLSLRDGDGARRLGFALNLPEHLGKTIEAAAELRQMQAAPWWSATFYVKGVDLHPAAWQSTFGWAYDLPIDGQASLELWGDWQEWRLAAVRGRANLRNSASMLRGFEKLEVDFSGRPQIDGWRWRSVWTGESGIDGAIVDCSAELARSELQGDCRNLRIQDLADILKSRLDHEQRTLWEGFAPAGKAPELLFRIGFDKSFVATSYVVAARIRDFDLRRFQYFPGLGGLDGKLILEPEGGRLELAAENLRIDVGDLLPAPIRLDNLTGPLRWRYGDAGLQLASSGLLIANKDLRAVLQGEAVVSAAADPMLDLRLDIRDLDLSRMRDYLPVSRMPPKLANWAERALVGGYLSDGDIVFRGAPTAFPFDDGEGLFEARFQVRDGVFDYFPDWPRLEDLEGQALFHNRSFEFEITSGRVFDARIEHARAAVADLADHRLTLRGRARGPAPSMLRFIRESPLAGKFGGYFRGLEATGENTLDLDLTIPFKQRPVEVSGVIGFEGGAVNLPAWDLDLQSIQGEIEFTKEGLSGDDLRLLFRGEPATVDLETRTRQDGRRETRFYIGGRFGLEALLGERAAAALNLSPVAGMAPWNMVLAVPAEQPAGKPLEFDLLLDSDLEGIAVDLPPPLGKPAAARRPLMIHAMTSSKGNLELWLDYAPDTRALLELAGIPGEPRFNRGDLRIGAGAARLPETPGLSVTARLQRLQFAGLAGGLIHSETGLPIPAWLRSVKLNLDELALGGQRFEQIDVRLEQHPDGLIVNLQGRDIAGRISIPDAPALPVRVDLRRLALRRQNGAGENNGLVLDPRIFPPLKVMVDDLSLDGRSLGSLRLSTQPQPNGLSLNEVRLNSNLHRLEATGDWLLIGQEPISRLQATLRSTALGDTLRAFGYTVGLERGAAEIELSLSSPSSLPDFSTALLNGSLSLHVGKGQLLNVEPGVGRMIGLFNLDTLSRRLSLDFSDLFETGMGFDRIDGSFSFRNGRALTDNLILEGPSAKVRVRGGIDLAAKQYDQTVMVTPRFGLAPTIAGTLAGGPAVGAAVFLAERVLPGEIGRAVRYRYSVSGPWHDPVIRPISGQETRYEKPQSIGVDH